MVLQVAIKNTFDPSKALEVNTSFLPNIKFSPAPLEIEHHVTRGADGLSNLVL